MDSQDVLLVNRKLNFMENGFKILKKHLWSCWCPVCVRKSILVTNKKIPIQNLMKIQFYCISVEHDISEGGKMRETST